LLVKKSPTDKGGREPMASAVKKIRKHQNSATYNSALLRITRVTFQNG
jgi:hypothetical protein